MEPGPIATAFAFFWVASPVPDRDGGATTENAFEAALRLAETMPAHRPACPTLRPFQNASVRKRQKSGYTRLRRTQHIESASHLNSTAVGAYNSSYKPNAQFLGKPMQWSHIHGQSSSAKNTACDEDMSNAGEVEAQLEFRGRLAPASFRDSAAGPRGGLLKLDETEGSGALFARAASAARSRSAPRLSDGLQSGRSIALCWTSGAMTEHEESVSYGEGGWTAIGLTRDLDRARRRASSSRAGMGAVARRLGPAASLGGPLSASRHAHEPRLRARRPLRLPLSRLAIRRERPVRAHPRPSRTECGDHRVPRPFRSPRAAPRRWAAFLPRRPFQPPDILRGRCRSPRR